MISAALMKGIISFQRKWGHDIIETANEEIITSVRLEESDVTSGLQWKIKFAHLFTLRSILTMQSASYSCLFMGQFLSKNITFYCKNTASDNDSLLHKLKSMKTRNSWHSTATKETWLISVSTNNIAKFHSRDSSLIKQYSSKFYKGRHWNILNRNTCKEQDYKHIVISCHASGDKFHFATLIRHKQV